MTDEECRRLLAEWHEEYLGEWREEYPGETSGIYHPP